MVITLPEAPVKPGFGTPPAKLIVPAELEKPGVWGVVSREEDQETMEKAGVKPFEDGFLAGVNSLILLEGAKRNIPVTYLMGESHHGYPDPGSAAATVEESIT